ncbi:hypothetical protein EBX93_18665 [bacterium]|nr:hypothetical protein [bacterium]
MVFLATMPFAFSKQMVGLYSALFTIPLEIGLNNLLKRILRLNTQSMEPIKPSRVSGMLVAKVDPQVGLIRIVRFYPMAHKRGFTPIQQRVACTFPLKTSLWGLPRLTFIT